jgi:NAD(P)-dependent dehydrogenase (short-subunit alcohol dehydrogenase family)
MAYTGGVFITGASTGIGEACALGLDELGYHVFVGVRKEADGKSLRQRASERLTPIIVDIVNEEQVRAAAVTVGQTLGDKPLVGLINNAGITVNGPLEFIPLDGLRRQLEVNVVGQVSVTQRFIPLLRKSKGRIINLSSTSGFFAVPILGPYCASKYAMEAISDVMRRELRPWGIEVVLLEPGAIATKIWEKGVSETEQFMEEGPGEMRQLYESLLERTRKLAEESERHAHSPKVVVKAVVHALTSPRPKTRYIMGANAWPQKIISMLPDRIQDRLVTKHFGM